MIEIPFVVGEILFTVIWLAWRTIHCIREKKISWKREALLILMYVNLAVIIRFTFFPFEKVNGRIQPLIFEPDRIFPLTLNLIPVRNLFTYDDRRHLMINIIGNYALFVPSGIILPIINKNLNSFWKVTAAGALLSLFIELAQLPFKVRTTDVDDLIMNTMGVMIGYGIYAAVRRLLTDKKQPDHVV